MRRGEGRAPGLRRRLPRCHRSYLWHPLSSRSSPNMREREAATLALGEWTSMDARRESRQGEGHRSVVSCFCASVARTEKNRSNRLGASSFGQADLQATGQEGHARAFTGLAYKATCCHRVCQATLALMRWMWMGLVFVAALTACAAAGPRYTRIPSQVCRPTAENGDGYGCDETLLNRRTLRVVAVHPAEATAHQWALVRTAEIVAALNYRGFTIITDDSHEMDTVRSRLIVGRVKRKTPIVTLTVSILTETEFGQVPAGTIAYDAHLLAGAGAH